MLKLCGCGTILLFFVFRLGTCKPKGTNKKRRSAKLIEAPGIATVAINCQGVCNRLCCSEKKHMAFDMPVLQHLQLFNEDLIKILIFISLTKAMLWKLRRKYLQSESQGWCIELYHRSFESHETGFVFDSNCWTCRIPKCQSQPCQCSTISKQGMSN